MMSFSPDCGAIWAARRSKGELTWKEVDWFRAVGIHQGGDARRQAAKSAATDRHSRLLGLLRIAKMHGAGELRRAWGSGQDGGFAWVGHCRFKPMHPV
jgi:hypothetical protein